MHGQNLFFLLKTVIADDNKPTSCYSTFDLNYKSSSSDSTNPENIDICKNLQNTQPKTAMEYTWQCMEKIHNYPTLHRYNSIPKRSIAGSDFNVNALMCLMRNRSTQACQIITQN
jgi:hypothetical protein